MRNVILLIGFVFGLHIGLMKVTDHFNVVKPGDCILTPEGSPEEVVRILAREYDDWVARGREDREDLYYYLPVSGKYEKVVCPSHLK